ncbi:MAG TPA: DUF1844 domain-containing protein [bacterium]|jgi:hypothetical protein
MEQKSPEDEQPSVRESTGPAAEPIDAPGLVRWCISLLAAHAWQSMGLIPNPATNKIERDLADARLAIDAAGALVDQVKLRLDDSARREMEALLTDLRVNYVEQQARANAS